MNEKAETSRQINLLIRFFAAVSIFVSLFVPIFGIVFSAFSLAGAIVVFIRLNKNNVDNKNDLLSTLIFSCIVFAISVFILVAALILNF